MGIALRAIIASLILVAIALAQPSEYYNPLEFLASNLSTVVCCELYSGAGVFIALGSLFIIFNMGGDLIMVMLFGLLMGLIMCLLCEYVKARLAS